MVGRDLKVQPVPPPAMAGAPFTSPGCSKLCPTWPWTVPGMGNPLGNPFLCLTSLTGRNFSQLMPLQWDEVESSELDKDLNQGS